MQYKDKYKKTIPPLLSTNYGNTANAASLVMPSITGDIHFTPGCSALALSQIIYYWNSQLYDDNQLFSVRNGSWKITKDGTTSLGKVDLIGNDCSGYDDTKERKIQWSKIPLKRNYLDNPTITSTYNATSKTYKLSGAKTGDSEFAQFQLDCALSLPSHFSGKDGSTAAPWEVSNYTSTFEKFKLSSYTFPTGNIEKLEDFIYGELLHGRPVSMAGWRTDNRGGGHAFVCDGYDSGLFHINWGWGGDKDGWYRLGALSSFIQTGGYSAPTSSANGTGDGGRSYAWGIKGRRIYPKNSQITIEDYSKKHYNVSTYSTGKDAYNDLQVINIDTTYCDGNIIPINNTYKCREQWLKITVVNHSKYDYYHTNLKVYVGSIEIDTFRINAHAGETVVHEIIWSPKYPTINAGTYAITVKSDKDVTLSTKNNSQYSITFTKRSSYKHVALYNKDTKKGLDYSIFKNNISGLKIASNTLFLCIGGFGDSSDIVINENNYPVFMHVVFWFRVGNPNTGIASYYKNNRNIIGIDAKTIIPANAKGKDIRIPLVIQNLIRGMKFQIKYENTEVMEKDYIYGAWTGTIENCPTVNYWTSEGNVGDYIHADNADYSNTTIVVEDSMLAVDFSGVTFKGITPNNNPNTIYIFDSSQTVPSSLNGKNIVKGNSAEILNLYEGYNMYFPKTFTANKVIYHYTPKVGVTKGTNKGWKTISFPFNVDKIECESKEIDWFHSDTDTDKQFWLKGFDGVEYDSLATGSQYQIDWKDVDTIEKNTSYIVAFPGTMYGKDSLVDKEILFIGNNCTFNESIGFGYKDGTEKVIYNSESTASYIVPPENILNFSWSVGKHEVWNSSNYKQTTHMIDLCGTTLSRNERFIYKLSEDGSTFEYSENVQSILPFEAYFKDAYRRSYVNNDLVKPRPNRIKATGNTPVDSLSHVFKPSEEQEDYRIIDTTIHNTMI